MGKNRMGGKILFDLENGQYDNDLGAKRLTPVEIFPWVFSGY